MDLRFEGRRIARSKLEIGCDQIVVA